jgi:hypothetical protein
MSQLWDAGPVKIISRSHKRGAPPVNAICREPGCSKPRRLVQGARYCEEHARGKGYMYVGAGPTVIKTCRRPGCDTEFPKQRKLENATSMAWVEFCPGCRNESPLTLDQLQRHHAPRRLIIEWLDHGADLRCAICEKRLTRRSISSRPVLDHDRSCCPNGSSCGTCIRGVVCQKCNTELGHLEGLLAADLLDRAVQYVKRV